MLFLLSMVIGKTWVGWAKTFFIFHAQIPDILIWLDGGNTMPLLSLFLEQNSFPLLFCLAKCHRNSTSGEHLCWRRTDHWPKSIWEGAPKESPAAFFCLSQFCTVLSTVMRWKPVIAFPFQALFQLLHFWTQGKNPISRDYKSKWQFKPQHFASRLCGLYSPLCFVGRYNTYLQKIPYESTNFQT